MNIHRQPIAVAVVVGLLVLNARCGVDTDKTSRESDSLVAQLLKGDVEWTIRCAPEGEGILREGNSRADGVYLQTKDDSMHQPGLLDSTPPLSQVSRPLMRALDDPKTALKAHVALAARYGTANITIPHDLIQIGGTYRANIDGIDVLLHTTTRFRPKSYWIMYSASAEMDPAKLPAVREQWHHRLNP